MAYNKNYQKSNNNNKPTAKSGAKLHQTLDHEKGLFIGAWKVIDGQMAKIKIFVSEKQAKKGVVKSKTGKQWVGCTMILSIPTKDDVVCNGVINIDNHKCYFSSWNWICNPKASNGGYIGKHISKNYN
ncbi:hypothetical protein [Polaribacter sp. Hel_I_88]|uniref:hypothetical protein n=1 Tax=Polaribacter sp. Hel_I_88 TaxID=1250006 RepID=UPI00047E0399|nr:hypothetical protein [Polaribacter sp. Hel_I_88]